MSDASRTLRRVVKLGGSLLGDRGVVARFSAWLQRQKPAHTAILVGGGGIVDELRRLDSIHGLSPRDAHWLAIDAMGVTSRLLAVLAVDVPLLCKADALEQLVAGPPRPAILDVGPLLREYARRSGGLTESWEVTSDSIAAWVARYWNADELVLLKSRLPDGEELTACTESDYVDPHFAALAARISRVCFVDLSRDDTPETIRPGETSRRA